MEWKLRESAEPEIGSKRIIEKFLFFPVKIGRTIKWLEKTKIVQIYVHTKFQGRETADKMWTNTQFY